MENPEITPEALAALSPSFSLTPANPEINEKIPHLISLSKQQGFVTIQDINQAIPESLIDAELIEKVMNFLDGLNVTLLDDDEVEAHRKHHVEAEEVVGPRVVYVKDRPFDPFDVYVKQVGRKPILTREQEVELFKALEAAEIVAAEGISVEVIDLRTLAPMDDEAIFRTVKKTNRLLIVHEDTRTGGMSGEITARVNETCFEWLDAPVLRVTAADIPLPYAPALEDYVLPQTADIVRAVRRLTAY